MLTGIEFGELRMCAKYSQRKLAKLVGMAPQTIQRQEAKGTEYVTFSPQYWPKLATLLNCDASRFYPPSKVDSSGDNSANSVNITASGDASVVNGSSNVNFTTGITPNGPIHLTALEQQLIELNREYGNNKLLKEMISRLLEFKKMFND